MKRAFFRYEGSGKPESYSKRVKIKIRYRSAVGLILFELKIFLRK
ncbi:hypothetical protein [Leptospira adleri]|nr:hypothetical protein [Leptospira adleri]